MYLAVNFLGTEPMGATLKFSFLLILVEHSYCWHGAYAVDGIVCS